MDSNILKLILSKVRRYYSISFDTYKDSTIVRIIHRRMFVNNITKEEDYVKYLDENENELKTLYKSFLIGVTDFFRDKEVFNFIKEKILLEILSQKPPDSVLRIWIPGCSTGQEVYSYGMLVLDALERFNKNIEVKILATDVTESALEYGSNGIYKDSEVENVPKGFLDKYFERMGNQYKVNQYLRKRIVFIKQDVVTDLPFTKIDLISCRNLLIYLKSETQNLIIQNFHKALVSNGFLILGQSETTNYCKECNFAVIDNSYKIFKKSNSRERSMEMFNKDGAQKRKRSEVSLIKERINQTNKREKISSQILEDVLCSLIETGVVVDDEYLTHYSFGNMEKYYKKFNGRATLDISKLVQENIRHAIVSGMIKCHKYKNQNQYFNVQYSYNGESKYVNINIKRLPAYESNELFLIEFKDTKLEGSLESVQNFNLSDETKEYISELELELVSLKDDLRSLIEELESSNNELKVSNEKLFASNEELQSTNEEINTANEELYSMNLKYEKKISELSLITNDLNNLIYSMNIATIFLDLDLILRKYTPYATKLFNIIPYDIGRPINHITSDMISFQEMMASVKYVLETGERTEREVIVDDKCAYFENVFPYKNEKDEIKGVIISYYDISELRQTQKQLMANEKRYRDLFKNMNAAFALHEIILDHDGRPCDYKFIDINSAFENMLGLKHDEIIGKTVKELFSLTNDYWIDKFSQVALKGDSIIFEDYITQLEKYYRVAVYSPELSQLAVIFSDITEQVKAIEREERIKNLKDIVSNVNKVAFWEMDVALKEFKPDDHWKILVGHQSEDTRTYLQYWIDKVHPEDAYAVDNFVRFYNDSSDSSYDSIYRLFNESKQKYIWMHCVGIVTERDERGYPLHLIGLEQDITEQKEIENHLAESKKWLERAQETAKISYFRYDCTMNKFIYPKEFAHFFGYEEYIEFSDLKSCILDEYSRGLDERITRLMKEGIGFEYDLGAIIGSKVKYIHTSIHGTKDIKGNMIEIFGIVQDITDRIEAQKVNEELSKKNARLQKANSLAITAGDLFVWNMDYDISPDGSFFYASKKYSEVFGIERDNRGFIRMEDDEATYCTDDEGREMRNHSLSLLKDTIEGKIDSYSKIITKNRNLKTGKIMYIEHNAQVEERYENGKAKTVGGFLRDITTEYENKRKIHYFAEHDLLTGLYNRNFFETYVNSKDLRESYTILICDIDGLKLINDAFGHFVGDEYLKLIADILSQVFNEDALVARIGGDEFAVVSYNTSETEIERIIQLIKTKLIQRKDREVEIDVDVSIGYEIVMNRNRPFSEAFIVAENIMYRRKLNERSSRKSNALDTIMEALNTKTEETKAHCERLQILASRTLEKLGYFRQNDIEDIMILANVHDIGKITIAEEILSKNGPLSDEERVKMMQHTEAGYKIIRNINDLEDIAEGILYHHERIDGKGYPHGLVGDEIPLFARIISVVDAYDAMTSDRVYRKAMTKEAAINELIQCAGTQFDPTVVEAFLSIISYLN